ncbi:MAG TPA: hypothetical protein VIH45_02010 [Desulfuromonadaceae bacterium]
MVHNASGIGVLIIDTNIHTSVLFPVTGPKIAPFDVFKVDAKHFRQRREECPLARTRALGASISDHFSAERPALQLHSLKKKGYFLGFERKRTKTPHNDATCSRQAVIWLSGQKPLRSDYFETILRAPI